MATDPTRPNPNAPWLRELLLDLTPGLGEVRSGRQAITDFQTGHPFMGALNTLGAIPGVGMAAKGLSALTATIPFMTRMRKAARLARAKEIIEDVKKAGGITLDLKTGGKVSQGFSVGGATKTKVVKDLTPETLLDYMDAAPEGAGFGAWFSNGKWHLDHVNVLDNAEEAAQLAVDRGEKAFGDLAKYASGQDGDVLILKHRTTAPLKAGQAFDPKFMGTGMAGAEKARTGRPGAIHFYGQEGKVEDMFRDRAYKEYYSFAPASDFLDLGSDEARKLMRQAGGDADELERLAIKKGYRGVGEAVDADVKSPYARTYKVFGQSPVLEKGKAAVRVPEAFKESTAAVEAKRLNEAARGPAVATLSPQASALMEYAIPSELAPFTKGNLARVNEIVATPGAIPAPGVMEAAAREGAEAVGGYRANADIIARRTGEDSPIFARLTAALSPKHPWKTATREPNIDAAVDFFGEWLTRGRPRVGIPDVEDMRKAIHARRAEAGLPLTNSMPTHYPNMTRAFNNPFTSLLSGPKANSFSLNLMGDLNPGTNDTRIAQALGWSEESLGGMTRVIDGDKLLVASPEYAVANAILGRVGANVGLPRAEAQEAIWDAVARTGLGAAMRQPKQLQGATRHPFAGILGERPVITRPQLGAPDPELFKHFLDQLTRSGLQQFPF